MSKMVIDIALIPDEKVFQYILDINKKLDWKIILKLNKNIPHLSLFKWCINESDLNNIIWYLDNLQIDKLKLNIVESKSWLYLDWKTSSLYIETTPDLMKLRESIAQNIGKYFSYDNIKIGYYVWKTIDPLSIKWIENYNYNTSSYHISLWFWYLPEINLPINFEVNKLWIYQMWNFCNCAKVIKEYILS
jgi:hypothetical protein